MHSPLTENAEGNAAGENQPDRQSDLVIDQHAFDDLDHFVAELGTSTVQLYKAGHSVEVCKEMLMATRHVGRAATLISNALRKNGKPAPREGSAYGWTPELRKDPCVEKVRAVT